MASVNGTGPQPYEHRNSSLRTRRLKNTTALSGPRAVLVDAETLERPREKKPEHHTVTLSTHNGGALETALRIPLKGWLKIGKPELVDVLGQMPSGVNVKAGTQYPVKKIDKANVFIHVPNTAIGILAGKRKPTKVDAFVNAEDKSLCINAPTIEWLASALSPAEALFKKPEPKAAEPPVPRVLQSLVTPRTPAITETLEGEGKISLRKNSAGSHISFAIPKTLLGVLADPPRVIVSGNVHEGFLIEPIFIEGTGVKVTYETNPDFAYAVVGLANKKLPDREARSLVTVHAVAKDNKIKFAGPPRDWVARTTQYRPKKDLIAEPPRPEAKPPTVDLGPPVPQPQTPAPVAAPITPPQQHIGASNGTPALFAIPADITAQQLVGGIGQRLHEVRAYLGRLQEMTGLQYNIRPDLTVGLKTKY